MVLIIGPQVENLESKDKYQVIAAISKCAQLQVQRTNADDSRSKETCCTN
jgi:hypothetical protein